MDIRKILKYCTVISALVAFFFIEIYGYIFEEFGLGKLYLSDVAANFFGLFPMNFLFLLISKKPGISQSIFIPPAIAFGFIIYEFLQIYLPWQTFDILDIYASLVAMVVCIPVNLIIYILIRNKS